MFNSKFLNINKLAITSKDIQVESANPKCQAMDPFQFNLCLALVNQCPSDSQCPSEKQCPSDNQCQDMDHLNLGLLHQQDSDSQWVCQDQYQSTTTYRSALT